MQTLITFLTALLLLTPLSALYGADLYVSSDGRADNPGTREKPLPTLEAARDAARNTPGTKSIFVRGGNLAVEVCVDRFELESCR